MADEISMNTVRELIDDSVFEGGIHFFDSIDSTSDWALEEIRRNRSLPFVCIADHQRKGRGRRGRRWMSPAGANIYMSLAWRFDLPVNELGMLAMAQGVAVIRTLAQIGICNAWLKWPNDVLIDDKKIAGVLVEARSVRDGCSNIIIGVGLNYRMPEEQMEGLDFKWTDVAHSVQNGLPRKDHVVAILLREVVHMCQQYQTKSKGLISDFKNEIDVMKGLDVRLQLESGDDLTGTILGVTPTGELRVEVSGIERVFSSADVSLSGRCDNLRRLQYADD